MAHLQEKIQAASTRNVELLKGLQETDSSPQQYEQQINYIGDLNRQIAEATHKVKVLKGRTAADLEEHKKYSESTFRRFAHKASGRKERFAEKAAKEEKDYFDALQAQKTAEDDLAYARQLLAEAENEKTKFENLSQRHAQFQRELDELLNSIFGGYTPGLPEEDEKERNLNAAQQRWGFISQGLEKERHVVHLLNQMGPKLNQVRVELEDARDLSRMDMWGGGSNWSMMKRNSLEKAQSHLSQVVMLQDQIRSIMPNIGDLGPLSIDTGSIWSDVIFDNIFTDMDMHDRIKDSQAQVDRAMQVQARQCAEAQHRESMLQADMQRASNELQQARQALQQARQDAFVKVAQGERLPDAANDPRTSGGAGPSPAATGMAWNSAMPPVSGENNPDEPPPAYSA